MYIALIVITLIVLFEYAALRWGVDTRDGFTTRGS